MKNPLDSLSYQQQRLLAQCSCTLLLVAVCVYGVLPQVRAQRALQTQIAAQEQRLAGPQVQTSDIAVLEQENWALQRADDGGQAPLVTSQLESRVLRALHDNARAAGVRLTQVQPERQALAGGLMVLQFEIDAAGSYSACAEWLEALDAPDSQLVLSSFSMMSEDDRGSVLRIRARVLSYHVRGESV